MKTAKNKVLGFVLLLAMILSIVSISIFAEVSSGTEATPSGTSTEANGSVDKPNATVSVLNPITLTPEKHNYMVWPSGDDTVDRPLQIVMNFKALETQEEAAAGPFADYACDFFLEFEGLAEGSIIADDCYLAGNYGNFGWIVIPTDGLELEEGTSYPVVAAYDAYLKYAQDICGFVKDFTAAIHVSDAILENNPDFKVTLSLRMTNPEDDTWFTVGEPATFSVESLTSGNDYAEVDGDLNHNAQVGGEIKTDTHSNEISDAKAALTALGASDAELNNAKTEILITLSDLVLGESAPDKLVFDVNPTVTAGDYSVKISEFNTALTFKLPMHSAETRPFANVYHEGDFIGKYEIKTEGTDKYVEVSSKNFSSFSVEPTEGYVAEVNGEKFMTLYEAVKVAMEGDTITLLDNADLAFTDNPMYNFVYASVIDLNGKTLTIKEGNLRFSTCIIKNGNIVVDASGDYSGNGVFYMFDEKVLTVDNVKITADNFNGYSIFCMEGKSDLNLQNGTEVLVNNATIYGIIAAVSDGEIVIDNSKITANTVTGRGFLNGNYTVKGTSEITLTGVTKDGFYIGAGDTLSIKDTAKVDITLNADGDGRYGINVNSEATYNKEATVTVNATDNAPTLAAKIGSTGYATLQAAIDAAVDGDVILLTADCAETVTVNKTDVAFTIDGAEHNFTGMIKINIGQNFTLKNINFVHEDTANAHDFIKNEGSPTGKNYNTTLVVESCDFVGNGNNADCAIRMTHPTSLLIKDCTGKGLHSLLQNSGGQSVTVENVTVTESKSGISLGGVRSAEVKESTISVSNVGYGIRIDAATENAAYVVESCTVDAFIPVCVRKASAVVTLDFNGTNTVTAQNDEGLWCAIGIEEYGDVDKDGLTAATGKVSVTLNDTGLDASGLHGEYIPPVVYIGEVGYATLKDALDAAVDGDVIEILAGTYEFGSVLFPQTLTNVTIKGADNKATVIKNSALGSANGSAVHYSGITIDGIVFDNTQIVFTGARGGEVIYKDWAITNCEFRNIVTSSNSAVHFNLASDETFENFTFKNNVIDGVSGGNFSGLRINYVSGNVVITDNTIKNVAWNAIQIVNSATANFVIEDNVLEASADEGIVNLYNVNSDSLTIKGNQFLVAEDQPGIAYISSADVSGNYWGGSAPANLPAGVTYKDYYTTVESDGTLGGYVELPRGNVPNGYTSETGIWGQTWGNAKESYVIKIYDQNGVLMGTTTLRTDLDVSMDGDVEVSWHISLDPSTDTDEYWIQNWIVRPGVENTPTKVVLCIDGVDVNEGPINLNAPDDLSKIQAAVVDGDGYITGYYTTVDGAFSQAASGDGVLLLADVNGNVNVPQNGVIIGDGHQINGTLYLLGNATIKGYVKATAFDFENVGTVINIPVGATLELNGTGRMVIGHGCTFNITGSITDAKTADVADLTPSLIMPGASFTGAGVTFNVTNAYIKTTASYCSSSKSASGTFDFNITNSIWEQFGKLAFEAQSTAATVNFELKDSVLTTTSHLVFAVSRGEIVIDNSNVNVGASRQLENRSTMTIKNGSVVNGAVATSSNAINPGTIIVENATYAVTGQFSGAAEGTGTLIIKNGATVSVGSIVDKANIVIDATDMQAGDEINFTANLTNFAGTLEVTNNDKLDANIVDGKIVLAVKPVASINGVEYNTLEEAFKAATDGCTIEILTDVVVDYKWDCRDYATNGSHSQFKESVTINGNDHTIKFTGTVNDNNWNTVFRFEENATVNNLTIDISEATGVQRVITAKKSLTVDDLTIIGSARYGIIFGEGASADDFAAAEIVIKNSTLTGTRRAISDNEGGKDVKSIVIEGNTLNANVYVSAYDNVAFTGNTVTAGYVDIRSYTANNTLDVTATSNTLTANTETKYNYIEAGGTLNIQNDFILPASGEIAYRGYIEDSADREAIKIDLQNVYATESVVVKLYDANGNLLTTTTLIAGAYNGDWLTTNIVLSGTASGSWDTVISEKLTVANVPTKAELWIDGELLDSFEPALGNETDAAEYQLPAYLALDSVYKEAKIGETFYATIAAAIAAAQDGEVVTILPGEYSAINISNKNITIQGTVGDDGELLTTIKGGNPAITGHSFNGTIKDLKIVDAWKVMYAEPAGNVTVDNLYVTGATYGLHLIAYSEGLTWTIQNSYMDISWANSFGVYGDGDAAIVIKGNEFVSTSPYYPDYGALHVNTFLPKITVEENIFGENAKIMIRDSVTDTSNINISKNYHADGVDNAFVGDSDVTTTILEYYESVDENGNLADLTTRVAKIGNENFATLEAALNAAEDGDTVKLLADIELTGRLVFATYVSGGKAVTLDGQGHTLYASTTNWGTGNGKHLVNVNVDNITLKDIVLDCKNKAEGVNVYQAQNIVFDNVTIMNKKGWNADLTVNGSTLTVKNKLSASYVDVDLGSGVTTDLGIVADEGAVLDVKTIMIDAAAYPNTDLDAALSTDGTSYYSLKKLDANGNLAGYSNSLSRLSNGYSYELLEDMTVSSNVTILNEGHIGTIDTNGYTLTVADGKTLTVNGDLTFTGEGAVEGDLALGNANASVAGVAGLDITSSVENSKVVYENGEYVVVLPVANIGENYYYSLTDAIAAANEGDTIVLLASVEANEVILINKSVTINGNGHNITSNASRVIRITASNINVTLNNVNVVSEAVMVYPNDIRGISIDGEVTGTTLTLNDCSVDFTDESACDWSYAVNQSGESSTGNTVIINGGSYEGANVINLRGTGHTVNIDGATLTSTYAPNDLYYGNCVNTDEGSCNITVKNTTFEGEHAVSISGGQNSTVVEENNTDNTKHYIVKIGENYYYSLADALTAANEGDTIVLLADVTLDAVISIEQSITLDLNGKTVNGADGAIVFNVKAATVIKNGTILGNKSGTSSGLIDIYADLTMDGVTVETAKINALRFKASGCTATLDNCNVTGAFKGYGASVWVINSGIYKASSTSISEQINGTAAIYGGTFHYEPDVVDCAPGYVIVDNGDGTYGVKYAPAAFIDANNNGVLDDGEIVYGNLDQIFANHKEGDVYVVLTDNIVANAQVDTDVDAKYYFTTNVAEGVTMDFLFADDWNLVQKMSIGENITLNVPYLYVWTEFDLYGTVNTDYAYFHGAKATVYEGASLNVSTGDATVQVKNGAILTVNGTVDTAILNVWVGESKLIVSGENALVDAKWIDIWDGTPEVTVENDATLSIESIKASRGGSIVVDNATLNATDSIELGHNGDSAGALIENGNSTINGTIDLTVVGSTVTSDGGLNVSTEIPDHKVVYENGEYKVVAKVYVAYVGEAKFETLTEALDHASTLTGDVEVTILAKVTLNKALSGSYDSIKFVGGAEGAEIYLDVQGYITASGKDVVFEDLTLSKAAGGFIGNAGFMNVAFGVYDVDSVTYNNCYFANGAYASSGVVEYNECTFKRSHDKYGLWAYGNVDVTVNRCTFDDYRGIKMYAEGKAKTTNLTVIDTDFSAVNDKPAIVLTYGESVTLQNNVYSNTGVFELDLDGAPNGTLVTTDDLAGLICENDNGACGVLVDGKIYTTVTEAAAVATYGSEVVLLHNATETVALPAGVELNKNGYEAQGVTIANNVKVGDTFYEALTEAIDAAQNGDTVILLTDIVLDDTLVIDKSITLDGNGHKITPADSAKTYNSAIFVGNSTWGDDHGETVKLINLEVSGWTANFGVIRVQGVSFEMDGCTVSDNTQTNANYGVVTLTFADSVLTNSIFENNTCIKVVDINSNGDGSNAVVNIDSCKFEGNDCTGAGVIFLNSENGLTVNGCEFVDNTVSANNCATIYLGYRENCKITGNLFENNTVNGSDKFDRVAGGVFSGYSSVITGNVFVNNTATNAYEGGTAASAIAIDGRYADSLYPDAPIDLSGNYFGGNAPVVGEDFTVSADEDGSSVVINNYVDSYSVDENGDLVLGDEVALDYVARVGAYSYETLAEAIAAAKAGDTVVLLADTNIGDTKLVIDKALTFEFGGFTVEGNNRKTFEVYADVTFRGGTILNKSDAVGSRCIDTRVGGITLNIENMIINASNQYQTQPITIGGNAQTADNKITVNITGSEIIGDVGQFGYGIMIFNPVDMTITDSKVYAAGAIELKAADGSVGSVGSVVTIVNSHIEGMGTGGDSNYGVIVIRDKDITITIDENSTVKSTANDEFTHAIRIPEVNGKIDLTLNLLGKAETAGKVVNGGVEGVYVTVADAAVAESLKALGYMIADNGDGTFKATVDTFAAERAGIKYASVIDAFEAAVDGDTVKLLADATLDGTLFIGKTLTIDLNGYTITAGYSVEAINVEANGNLTLIDTADNKGLVSSVSVYGKITVNAHVAVLTANTAVTVADLDLVDSIITNGNPIVLLNRPTDLSKLPSDYVLGETAESDVVVAVKFAAEFLGGSIKYRDAVSTVVDMRFGYSFLDGFDFANSEWGWFVTIAGQEGKHAGLNYTTDNRTNVYVSNLDVSKYETEIYVRLYYVVNVDGVDFTILEPVTNSRSVVDVATAIVLDSEEPQACRNYAMSVLDANNAYAKQVAFIKKDDEEYFAA